jgi:hypothetical protein
MEVSIIALMLLLGIGLMAWRLVQGRRAPNRLVVDELLGPLPEGDAREAELTESAESGRAASGAGAATPTAPYQAASGLDALGRLANCGRAKLGLATGTGAAVGLGLLVMARRRARRRRRIERMRQRARSIGRVATAALLIARNRASALPDGLPVDLDRRTSTGGGVALLATLGLLAAVRERHQRRARVAEAAEALRVAAEAAEAASRRGWRGWRGWRGRAATLAAETREVALPAVSHQVDRAPRWSPAMLTAIVVAVLLGVRAVQRRGEARVAASS